MDQIMFYLVLIYQIPTRLSWNSQILGYNLLKFKHYQIKHPSNFPLKFWSGYTDRDIVSGRYLL